VDVVPTRKSDGGPGGGTYCWKWRDRNLRRRLRRAQSAEETSVRHHARAGTLPELKRGTDTVLSTLGLGVPARCQVPWRPHNSIRSDAKSARSSATASSRRPHLNFPDLVGLVLKGARQKLAAIP